MTCPFCGLQFEPPGGNGDSGGSGERGGGSAASGGAASGAACGACPLHRWACGRRAACCPRCGYQSPLPPRWLRGRKKELVHGAE